MNPPLPGWQPRPGLFSEEPNMTCAVAIERRQVELAKKLADGIHASGTTTRRRNHTGLEVENRHFYGYCGEAAVINWLRAEGVTFQVEMGNGTRPNEIWVWHERKRRTIDVKTASQPHHRLLMIPCAQAIAADFYVAVRLDTDPCKLLLPREPIDGNALITPEIDAREAHLSNPYATASIIGWLGRDAVAGLRVEMFKTRTRVCDFINLRSPGALTTMLDKGDEVR